MTTIAVIAAAAVLASGALKGEEALESIDLGLLLLIYAMLAMGQALTSTGAAAMIVSALTPLLAGMPLLAVLLCVYALASLMTELVTNNAVAVVLAPIAIALAQSLALDPRPLLLLVMIGASASFATPIGYQTNTLVYSAGGYRFRDFLVMGAAAQSADRSRGEHGGLAVLLLTLAV